MFSILILILLGVAGIWAVLSEESMEIFILICEMLEALGSFRQEPGLDAKCDLEEGNLTRSSEITHYIINLGGDRGTGAGLSDSPAGNLSIAFEELQLMEVIGGGSFGQVYRGVWRGKPVAVKTLLPVAERDLNDALASGFHAEVSMLASIRHTNVCQFMAACTAPANRSIVMELVTRGSLWRALREEALPSVDSISAFRTPPGCWPWAAIMKVAEGMACGMNYLHRLEPSIIHRDLKSANLLLDDSFNVKICDFGLARLKAFTNTMTGNCGTVQWMAPEVIASSKYTETADVYSFGIVCWELLSRSCPFEGMNQIQVGMAVVHHRLRPEIPEWCPGEFASLIENAWHQNASRRRSFGDILQHLRNIQDLIS